MAHRTAKNEEFRIDHIRGRSAPLVYETGHWIFTIWGLLYIPGCRHGPESLEALSARLSYTSVPQAVAELRGVFALHLFDRHRCEGWWTVDGSGLFQLFLAPGYIGPDLLAAARSLPDPRRAVDPERFLQILAYDAPLDGGTLFSGVRVLGAGEVLHVDADGRRTMLPVASPAPEAADVETQLRIEMRHLAAALSGERVEANLTGGMDSRLLVLLAREAGLAFTTALTGPADGPEARVAAEVARRLGLPFRTVPHDVSRFPADLDEILVATGGLVSPLRFHIDWNLVRNRLERSVSVVLHGASGELLRDFYFVQELLDLWTGHRIDFARLWRLRVLRRPILPDLLPEKMAEDSEKRLFKHFCAVAKNIHGESRVERVIRICWRTRTHRPLGQVLSALAYAGVITLAPYADRRVMETAIRTSPWKLILQWPVRRLATQLDPEVATLPTVHGYTCSTALRHLLPDSVHRVRLELRRVYGRLFRWPKGYTNVTRTADQLAVHPDYHRLVREAGVVEAAVRTLVRAGLLAPHADPERLPASWHAPVVQVAKILDHLA